MENSRIVDVVIVAFNSGAWLARAVDSALTANAVANVIVVDNASLDGSVAQLPADSRLIVLQNSRNLGFATAANQGWHAAQAAYVLLLNPDCVLAPDDVRKLIGVFELRKDAGVVSAQLLNADGSQQIASLRRDPTPLRAIAESLGMKRFGIHIKAPAVASLVAVEACSGALMLMPKALLAQTGGFDEGYFLHCEDLDLCRRIRALGLAVLVDCSVQVRHDKGTSSTAVPRLVADAKYCGMLRYFDKFDRANSNVLLRAVVYGGAWLRWRWALLRARWANVGLNRRKAAIHG
jgi:N-acetylglucosaminyl-diphospho-decaprenol L-rhamnosyltransferase